MSKTIEQIKTENANQRKELREKEKRALANFATRVLQSATSNGKQMPEDEICKLIASASKNRFAQVSKGVGHDG